MQYSVPQFTDVEDKIIASLSIKQFAIIIVIGVIVFGFYSASKNITITVILAVVLGIPGLIITFGKVNGRPLYRSFALIPQLLNGSQTYVFHKQGLVNKINITQAAPPPLPTQNAPSREETINKLKQLEYTLQQQASEEEALLKRQQL